jgi:hypothetical protein
MIISTVFLPLGISFCVEGGESRVGQLQGKEARPKVQIKIKTGMSLHRKPGCKPGMCDISANRDVNVPLFSSTSFLISDGRSAGD